MKMDINLFLKNYACMTDGKEQNKMMKCVMQPCLQVLPKANETYNAWDDIPFFDAPFLGLDSMRSITRVPVTVSC